MLDFFISSESWKHIFSTTRRTSTRPARILRIDWCITNGCSIPIRSPPINITRTIRFTNNNLVDLTCAQIYQYSLLSRRVRLCNHRLRRHASRSHEPNRRATSLPASRGRRRSIRQPKSAVSRMAPPAASRVLSAATATSCSHEPTALRDWLKWTASTELEDERRLSLLGWGVFFNADDRSDSAGTDGA